MLAVDPSSPFSGGAILGDRVRMQAHAEDAGVFIRSMATRGQLGGLARTTGEAATVLDAAGFEVVIIETVGVGQAEVDIVRSADISVVVVAPGAGDDVQALKAGIMEIADVFVVNKADRDGADRTAAAIEGMLSLQSWPAGTWRPPVLQTVATSGRGMGDLVRTIQKLEGLTAAAPRRHARAFREMDVVEDTSLPLLDHVGIAVQDATEMVALFRDLFSLETDAPEDVGVHRLRFVDTGPATLELVEPLSPGSAVAKFLSAHKSGLHHICLRVAGSRRGPRGAQGARRQVGGRGRPSGRARRADCLLASVEHRRNIDRAEGTLIDIGTTTFTKHAKTGFGGSSRRFAPFVVQGRSQMRLGEFELISLSDGWFRLDGGAMFGVIPKPMWETRAQPDERNRILMGVRPLLIRTAARHVIVDAGIGDKMGPKETGIYGIDRRTHLDHSLAAAGLTAENIDLVIASHLHFDHAGGFTVRDAGRLRPRFPRARYVIRRGEWEDATHPHERNRASYLGENFLPLQEAGVIDFCEDDGEITAGRQRPADRRPHDAPSPHQD